MYNKKGGDAFPENSGNGGGGAGLASVGNTLLGGKGASGCFIIAYIYP